MTAHFDANKRTRHPVKLGEKTISHKDLMSRERKKREHVIFPWLREDEAVMLWGNTGLGKSMLTLTIALAVAGGGEFADWKIETPRKILYVDGEMHIEDVQDRLEILHESVIGIDHDALGENLDILSRHEQEPMDRFYDLTCEDNQNALLEKAINGKYDFVILDNFTALSESLDDENSAAEMKAVSMFMTRFKRAGIASMLVHHSTKGGDAYRGSSALAAPFEIICGLKPIKDSMIDDVSDFDHIGARFCLEFTKVRGQRDDTLETRIFSLPNRPEGEACTWTVKKDPSNKPNRVVQCILSHKCASNKEVADVLNWSTGEVSKQLTNAKYAKLITGQQVKSVYSVVKRERIDQESETE